jgi:hypothetical protein
LWEDTVGLEELRNALQSTSEIELIVTGRKSGRESSRPVWFVQEGDKLFLLPVGGSDSNWYKNLVKTSTIGLAADGAEFRTNAKPIERLPWVTSSRSSEPGTGPIRSRPITRSSTPLSRFHSPELIPIEAPGSWRPGSTMSRRAPIAQLDRASPS